MKRWVWILLLAAAPIARADETENQKQIEQLQKMLQVQETAIKQLQNRLQAQHTANAELQTQNAEFKSELLQLRSTIKEFVKVNQVLLRELKNRRAAELPLKTRNIELAERLQKAKQKINQLQAQLEATREKAAANSAKAQKQIDQAETDTARLVTPDGNPLLIVEKDDE
ncbi:MAG: hypothetical protein R3236_02115, partial [Phycisphaeraceae bacterium]|nr:hypothetical protein [Phycisphaeraceae bacterium]